MRGILAPRHIDCCCQEGQGGREIKGIFAGPKPEKVNREVEIFLPHAEPGAEMWRQAFGGEGRGVDSSA